MMHSFIIIVININVIMMMMIKLHKMYNAVLDFTINFVTQQNSTATADVGGWACTAALGENVPEYEVALAGTQAMVRNIAKLYPNSELMDSKSAIS